MFGARVANGKDGVSAVIAVILMVAITVVLAGVLYVWVWQIVPNHNNRQVTIGLTSMGKSQGYYEWSVASIQGNAGIVDVQVKVYRGGAAVLTADFSGKTSPDYDNATMDEYKDNHVIIFDNDQNGYLSEGDTVKIDASFVSTGDSVLIFVGDTRAASAVV